MGIDKVSISVVPILLRHYIDWQKENAEDDIGIKWDSHFLLILRNMWLQQGRLLFFWKTGFNE